MRARVLLGLISLAVSACSHETESKSQAEVTHGSLAVALTGRDIHGRQYRLRDAEFDLYGCPDWYYGGGYAGTGAGGTGESQCISTTLSSEDDPDSAVITKRLVPGSYNVSLRGGWRLEEMTEQGPQPIAKAVLLSSSNQYVYVWDRGQATAFFQFGVNGDLIDFRYGDLNIEIQVEQPGDHDCYYGYAGFGYGGAGAPRCPVGGSFAAGSGGVGGSF